MLNTADFIKKLAPMAQEDNILTGVPACITIAQGILESNWGKSSLSTVGNNLFGIKGKGGGDYATKEQLPDGSWVTIQAGFRHYTDWSGSVKDHSHVLLNSSYGNGKKRYISIIGETDYKKAAMVLQANGYATDQRYAAKLISLIETYNLVQYNMFKEEEDMSKIQELEDKLNAVIGELHATRSELAEVKAQVVEVDPPTWCKDSIEKAVKNGVMTEPKGTNTFHRVIKVLDNLKLL